MKCIQCGVDKGQAHYRPYNHRPGSHKRCVTCERLNARQSYLQRKGALSDAEAAELLDLKSLHQLQARLGLRVPNAVMGKATSDVNDDLAQALEVANAMHDKLTEQLGEHAHIAAHEPDLVKWLTCPLDQEPDHYLDNVYDALREKYRPRVGIDPETLLPVYDDKYLPVLEAILERFYKYEDDHA